MKIQLDNKSIAFLYLGGSGINTYTWFSNYGSIANTYQGSFSATCHMRKDAGTFFNRSEEHT